MTMRDGRPITEHDLLAYVEGEADGALRARIERALETDAPLTRAVAGMACDCRALRGCCETSLRAPGGVVDRALEIAQRDALVGAGGAVVARIGPAQWRKLALAAGLFLVAGVSYVMLRPPALKTAAPPISADNLVATLTDAPARESALADLDLTRGSEALATASGPEADASAALGAPPALPLREALTTIDDSGVDLSEHVLTLEVREGQNRPVYQERARPTPVITPASYADALSLAALNRLTVRVRTSDPERVVSALRAFRDRMDRDVSLTAEGGQTGTLRYAVETDRDEDELSLLVTALRRAEEEGSGTRVLFDVPLLPSARGVRGAGMMVPVQATSGSPRVSLPVLIETAPVGRPRR